MKVCDNHASSTESASNPIMETCLMSNSVHTEQRCSSEKSLSSENVSSSPVKPQNGSMKSNYQGEMLLHPKTAKTDRDKNVLNLPEIIGRKEKLV